VETSRNVPSRKQFLVVDGQVNAEGIHVWPFDPNFPVDVVHHSLSGRQPFRMNRHEYFELVCVTSGELVWQVQNQMVTERKGDLFVVGGPIYHRVTEYSRPRVRAVSLFFHPEIIRSSSVAGDDAGYLMPFLFQDHALHHVVPARTGIPAEVLHLIQLVDRELPPGSDLTKLYVVTCLKMILILLLRHYAGRRATTRSIDRRRRALARLRPFFDFLETAYARPISLAAAAATVHLSRAHFRRSFKQITGQSFVSYLNHFRIAKGQELLAKTDKSIAEVSQEAGFCDQSYFGLVFRRLTRLTPFQYRQQSRSLTQMESKTVANRVARQGKLGLGHVL